MSPDAGALICCRALQGLGGAPLVPLAIGLLIGEGGAATGSSGRVPLAAGLEFFAAPALGVFLGGLLIGAYGWRSIFLINLPIGLLALSGAFAAYRAGLGVRGDRAVRPDLPDANTLFSVAQRLAGSFGIALLVTFFTTRGAATGSPLTGFRETALVLAATALLGTLGATGLRLASATGRRVGPDST
ncbi:hypothetical protein [Microbispora sp. H10830]|uniref:hypothetical protein n=1 Tax=Microbispora sp. H10830 TaxID=2729109 RepID=UPI0016049A99|nr:hypothetical protein [Microbispora sp. H10830]